MKCVKRLTIAFALPALIAAPLVIGADSKPVATVNGKAISEETLELYSRLRTAQLPEGQKPPREALVNELVTRELIYQDAVGTGLDKNPDIVRRLELQREEIIINAALQRAAASKPISEKDLRAEYDRNVAAANVQEYKARHILTKTQDEAREAIKALDKGADFAALAKEKSTGPSGPQGGDLGWFTAGNMVPEFAQAVEKMKKGTYTKEPVKTQFGWHVIKLEDTRKVTPPAFEDVKEQLESVVRNKRVRDYVEALRAKAKVTTK